MAEPHILYQSLPNIIVNRYEAQKKTGYAGLDENGTLEIIWALKNRITTVDIVAVADDFGTLMQSYTIDAHAGNNYDFTVYPSLTTYIDFTNFEEGQEITCIAKNGLIGADALLVFNASEVIKWLNNDLPEIRTNAKITFYKSEGIIYAEIKKPYIGGSTSTGSDADAPINLVDGTFDITDEGIYYIYASTAIVQVNVDILRTINKRIVFKIMDDTFDFVINSTNPASLLDGVVVPVTTSLITNDSIEITSDGVNLNAIE